MRKAICITFGLLLLAVRPAHAIPYETFVDVDDEADLQDLLSANDISQDTYDELLDLLEQGVDLNTADRAELYTLPNLTYDDVDKIIAFRNLQHGRINDPSDLVAAGALTQEQLLSISAFLITRPPGERPGAVHAWLRAQTRMSYHDRLLPPFSLRGRMTAMQHLTAGFAATSTRLIIGDPSYDPNRDALIADPRSNQIHIPKAYVKWEDGSMTLIAGSFRAGFAQRLVFDDTRHYTPNGLYLDDQLYYSGDLVTDCKESAGELLTSPCSGAAGNEYITPDFIWRDALFGVGAGVKKLELATGWLQAYGWASGSRRSMYQYDLVEHKNPDGTDHCVDPRNDSDPACAAPTIYVRPEGSLLTPTTRFAFETLPNVFLEKLAGGNVTYFANRRSSVGLTGYAAQEQSLVGSVDLDFQEFSRYPFGKRYGALGANFAYGQDWFDIFGEAALSFDNMPPPDPTLTAAKGGGGPAGLIRMTATKKKEELELVARYFSTDYLNPYSRPISEPDTFEGQRARDEAGVRVRYIRSSKEFQLRALVDVWTNPSGTTASDPNKPVKLDTYVRANVRTTDDLWLGLWERYQDKDLRYDGHMQCFEIPIDTTETGAPIPCFGRQLTTIARAHYVPSPFLTATLMLEHQLLDDYSPGTMRYANSFRQDIAAWAIVLWKPDKLTRIRARARYLDEAIDDNTYLERSFSALTDVSRIVNGSDKIRVRIDTKVWLDKRAATLLRVPNPELTLWLSYEARL